jgi:integrase
MTRDPIRTVILKEGAKRYRFVVDVGRDPDTGRRKQKTHTFDRKGDARRAYDRIRHQTADGTYIPPSRVTVDDLIDSYLKGATRGRRANTAQNYQLAFRCVRDRLGSRVAQTISKDDIEDLVDHMLTAGRKRGGKPGTGLSGRSVNLTLGRLRAAFEQAVREGKLARNVVALVEAVTYRQVERETWTKDEVHTFLRTITGTRLEAAWRLSLYGLRRGEVLGLRWQDVDLNRRSLQVVQTRVIVGSTVAIEPPKSRNGERVLPLDDDLSAALTRLRKTQLEESARMGPGYDGAGGFVVVDEAGTPVKPDWYSGEFERVLKAAGLRRITLHDSRHTTLSLMEKAGVPISVISKWAGHFDSAFTQKTYVHATTDDMTAGAESLGRIYRLVEGV